MQFDQSMASPLHWPEGWRRTQANWRKRAKFNNKSRVRVTDNYSYMSGKPVTISAATDRLWSALSKMGVPDENRILSTDLKLRQDGLPRSGQAMPDDPGAAVYWLDCGGESRCMAVDLYDRVADNIAALAATLDAMRAIERHGGAEILNRAYKGFAALPDPNKEKPWHQTLGVQPDCSFDEAKAAYRRLAANAHPDRGGSHSQMSEINSAWDRAKDALS